MGLRAVDGAFSDLLYQKTNCEIDRVIFRRDEVLISVRPGASRRVRIALLPVCGNISIEHKKFTPYKKWQAPRARGRAIHENPQHL
jgi:hypothetical protein